MKHKHAELIKKWADGAKIQSKYSENYDWEDVNPSWGEQFEYRIKPEKEQMTERDLDAGATIDELWYIHQKPEQKPVAWVCYESSDSEMHDIGFEQEIVDALSVVTMLYTTPPLRKPLTYEQLDSLWQTTDTGDFELDIREFARAIEVAHGIKE